ncbi:hypothetical protein SDC9_146573 [bioreactor metagenome]|uniref:Uncharacterized protein n=1 Tax=bioreactor metagenome TaxID=1076179 RepID=A0A645EFK9_9ZZZZ
MQITTAVLHGLAVGRTKGVRRIVARGAGHSPRCRQRCVDEQGATDGGERGRVRRFLEWSGVKRLAGRVVAGRLGRGMRGPDHAAVIERQLHSHQPHGNAEGEQRAQPWCERSPCRWFVVAVVVHVRRCMKCRCQLDETRLQRCPALTSGNGFGSCLAGL